jgi:multicomponent Na+:H+ antiporter subunit G
MMVGAVGIVGGVFLVVGALLILLAGVGVTRFGDVFSRMHAAAKAPVLGIMFVGIGTAISVGTMAVAVSVALIVVLQLIAGPVGAHVLGRSVYYGVRPKVGDIDELAEYNARADRDGGERPGDDDE